MVRAPIDKGRSMSYSNPMHHRPGARRPAPLHTLPDGTRHPACPSWWPFGALKSAPPIPPLDVRIRTPREPLPAEPAPF